MGAEKFDRGTEASVAASAMVEHIMMLRQKTSSLRNTAAIVLPENNLGCAAALIRDKFKDSKLDDFLVLYDMKSQAPGRTTSNESKHMLSQYIYDRLLKDVIRPSLEFASLSVQRGSNHGTSLPKLWDELIAQLSAFTEFHEPYRKTKLHGNQAPDDFVLALMIAIWSYILFNDQREAYLAPSPFNTINRAHVTHLRQSEAAKGIHRQSYSSNAAQDLIRQFSTFINMAM